MTISLGAFAPEPVDDDNVKEWDAEREWDREEEYDCPIHGKLGGIDECPLC